MRGKNMRCAAERHSIWLCSSSHLPSLAYRPNRETYDSCRESYDSFRKSYSSNHEPWLGKFTVHKKSGRVPSSHHSPTRFPTLSRRVGQERTAKHRRRTTRRFGSFPPAFNGRGWDERRLFLRLHEAEEGGFCQGWRRKVCGLRPLSLFLPCL